MTDRFVGTGALVRLALRRDRVRLGVWVLALVGLVGFTGRSITSIYTRPELAAYARTADGNATIVALSAPARGLGTYGGRIAFETWQLALAFGLFGLLTVVRHTRHEEESGRAELVRAAAVGRHAHSAAAVIVAGGGALVVGLGCAAAVAALGVGVAGAVVLGLGLTSLGWSFAAVGLLAAQVTEHGRAATGAAVAVMGLTYLARAVGDVGNGALSWISPFGWAQAARPFAGDRLWPLGLAVVVGAAVVALALAVEARRDVGAGLVRPRPGPAVASSGLASPWGLAWRLQRSTLAAWAFGAALLGVAMGSVAHSADDLVGDNQQIRDYLASVSGAGLADVFLATVLVYLALLASGFAVQATLRARAEEAAGRAEALLATATSRRAWAGGHLAVAAGGGVVVLVVSAAAMGLAHGVAVGDPGQVLRLTVAAAAFVPALLVTVGVAAAVVGGWPRAAPLAWAVVAVATVVGVLGDGLGLPAGVRDLSPFAHVPSVPAAPVAWTPLALTTVVAVVLVGVGAVALDRRDIG